MSRGTRRRAWATLTPIPSAAACLLSSLCAAMGGMSENVATVQDDARAITSLRDRKLRTLAEQYEAAREAEPGRSLELYLTNGIVRRDFSMTVRRRGGKWLPGVASLPWYNKSKNLVDASGLEFEGDRLKGEVKVILISDSWVPPPGTTYDLEFVVDCRIKDKRISGTYRAGENREMSHWVYSNQVLEQQTRNMKMRRGSPADILRLLEKIRTHQSKHWDGLSGSVGPFTAAVPVPGAWNGEEIADPDPAALYRVAVIAESRADEAYRQIRAWHLSRLTGVPHGDALALCPSRGAARPAFDMARVPRQMSLIVRRVARMRAIVEAAESWEPAEPLCRIGEVTTEDPWFRGAFVRGPLGERDGVPNHVPPVAEDGKETWHYVRKWQVLGPFPEDRRRRLIVPLPELLPAAGAAHGEGEDSAWREVAKQEHAFMDIRTALGNANHRLCYATAEVLSAEDQEVWASLLPKDFCRLWVNDRLVWANITPQRDASVFRMPLRKGRNSIDVRCGVDTHEWGIALKLCTAGRPRTADELKAAAPAAAPLATAGWYGPRHDGVYHDADPAIAWDIKRGINVLWRLPFGRKSIATPVVAGDKVFTLAEPHTLVCADKFRGKILWQRDSNVLEFIEDPEERKQALADWERESGDSARAVNKSEIDRLQRALAEVSVKLKADEANEELRARGVEIEAQMAKLRGKSANLGRWFHKAGSGGIDPTGNGGWFQSYVGYTAGTPVTDGKHIWVKHGTGVAACYDLDGKRKWMKRTHFSQTCSTESMPSPMLAGGKLIIVGSGGSWRRRSKRTPLPATAHGGGLGSWMIAMDRETGEIAWDAGPIRNVAYGVCNTPYPMKLSNGKEEMWVIVTSTGQLLRAEDGQQLLDHMGVRGCFHASPVHYGNRVYLSRGGHVDAVELMMQDRDTVGVRRLWTSGGGGHAGCVVYGGRVHCTSGSSDHGKAAALSYVAKDVNTGRDVARIDPCLPGDSGDAYVPPVVAGKYVFAFAGSRGSVIELSETPRVLAHVKNERMYAQPVFDGDRMYLRTYNSLMCIGRRGPEGEAFEKETQANMLMSLFPRRFSTAAALHVATRRDLAPDPRRPVWSIVTGAMPDQWISAGTFVPGDVPAPLASLGGWSEAAPVHGTELVIGEQKSSFRREESSVLTERGLEIDATNDGPLGADRYYYTVLDNRVGSRALRVRVGGPADRVWVGGQPANNFDVASVEGTGLVPVLVRVRFPPGLPPFRKRGAFMVYFEEVEDPNRKHQAELAGIRTHADALLRVTKLVPGSRAALRAQHLLSLVRAEEAPKGTE